MSVLPFIDFRSTKDSNGITDFEKSVILIYKDGLYKDYTYKGFIDKKNRKNGHGKLISPALITYEGEWYKDKPVGDFTVVYPMPDANNKLKYIGTINNKLERHGKNGALYKESTYNIEVRSLCIRDIKDLRFNTDIYRDILSLPKGEWINDIPIGCFFVYDSVGYNYYGNISLKDGNIFYEGMGCEIKSNDHTKYMFGLFENSYLMTCEKSIICDNRLLFIGSVIDGEPNYGKMIYLDKNRVFVGLFKAWFEPSTGIITKSKYDKIEKWSINDDMTCTYETPQLLCKGHFKYLLDGLPVMYGDYETRYFNGTVVKGRINYVDKDLEDTPSGKILYSNGDIYEGEISGYMRNGFGKMTYINDINIPEKYNSISSYFNNDKPIPLPSKCGICLTNESNILFLPCGHFRTCTKCFDEIFKNPVCECPYCRNEIIFLVSPEIPDNFHVRKLLKGQKYRIEKNKAGDDAILVRLSSYNNIEDCYPIESKQYRCFVCDVEDAEFICNMKLYCQNCPTPKCGHLSKDNYCDFNCVKHKIYF